MRGLYFNGTDQLMSLSSGNLYLHAAMTIEAWIRPESESGSVFSKSYNDYAVAGNEDFFSIRLDTVGRFNVVMKHESTSNVATVNLVYSLNAWDFIAIKIEYTTTDYKSSITGFSNGIKRDTIEYT